MTTSRDLVKEEEVLLKERNRAAIGVRECSVLEEVTVTDTMLCIRYCFPHHPKKESESRRRLRSQLYEWGQISDLGFVYIKVIGHLEKSCFIEQ